MLTTGDPQASLADGGDIRFTSDIDGKLQLPVHVVEYTQNAVPANATANIWVKVPSIENGTDTVIYIWWGNANATMPAAGDTYGQYNVWTANSHRWMLDDDQDATINNRDLTDVNVTFGAAVIDNGMEFNADGGESVSFTWIDETIVSFEFWLNMNVAHIAGELVLYAFPFEVYTDDPNPNKFRIFFKSNWDDTNGIWRVDTEYDTATWYHFLVTYNGGAVGNDPTFTVNGAVVAGVNVTETSTPVGNLRAFGATGYLGRDVAGDLLQGDVDEVFVTVGSEVAPAWAITAYRNQSNPAAFSVEDVAWTINRHKVIPNDFIRAYQKVDPLVGYSIRAYQNLSGGTDFSIRPYQGGRGAFLTPEYENLVKSGYRITAVDTTTLEETDLGFINADDAPLTLSGITLADGTYDLLVYLQGFLWHDQVMIDRLRVVVSGGVVIAQLPPPIEELRYTQLGDYTRFLWTWSQTFGSLDPDTFGVWISNAAPPATAGTPDITVVAETPRNYSATYLQGSVDTIWVAVAAISGATRGPESRLTALAPQSALSSPTTQQADDDELMGTG